MLSKIKEWNFNDNTDDDTQMIQFFQKFLEEKTRQIEKSNFDMDSSNMIQNSRLGESNLNYLGDLVSLSNKLQVSIKEGRKQCGLAVQTSPDRGLGQKMVGQSDLSERVGKSDRNPKELTLGLNGEENFIFGGGEN